MSVLLGSVCGWIIGAGVLIALLRRFAPRDTEIRCAWCGHPVPMAVAVNEGVGGVNRVMQEHVAACPLRPRA